MLVPETQGAHARMFVSARTLPRARALIRYKKWTDPQLLPPIRWKKWPICTDPGTDPL